MKGQRKGDGVGWDGVAMLGSVEPPLKKNTFIRGQREGHMVGGWDWVRMVEGGKGINEDGGLPQGWNYPRSGSLPEEKRGLDCFVRRFAFH